MGLATDLSAEDRVDVVGVFVAFEGLAVEHRDPPDLIAHDPGGVVEGRGRGEPLAAVEVAFQSETTDCEQERLPLVRRMKARSPGCTKACIFRQTFTWSKPAFVRESEASTARGCGCRGNRSWRKWAFRRGSWGEVGEEGHPRPVAGRASPGSVPVGASHDEL